MRPEILPCKECGAVPVYVGSHGNTFGDPPYHVHYRCRPLCACAQNKLHPLPDISRWNELNRE